MTLLLPSTIHHFNPHSIDAPFEVRFTFTFTLWQRFMSLPLKNMRYTIRMFSAIIRVDTFRTTHDTVSVLLDECRIHLEEHGIEIQAADPATVGLVDLELGTEAFESYETDGGIIGVNLSRLQDIAKMADADQLIEMELDAETRKLHLRIDDLEYTLALIDPDTIRSEPSVSAPDLPAAVVVEGRVIDRGVRASDMVGETIILGVTANEEIFYVEATGDTDDVHLERERDDLIDLEAGDAHSLFSLDYLKDMNKAIPKDAEITLELGEEFPLIARFTIAEGGGHVTYILSPRVTNF
jgi:proliferating cell nuclear antigen